MRSKFDIDNRSNRVYSPTTGMNWNLLLKYDTKQQQTHNSNIETRLEYHPDKGAEENKSIIKKESNIKIRSIRRDFFCCYSVFLSFCHILSSTRISDGFWIWSACEPLLFPIKNSIKEAKSHIHTKHDHNYSNVFI